MTFIKFNITKVGNFAKRLNVNQGNLRANFKLVENEGKASVEYDVNSKKIMIHTQPSKEDITFPTYKYEVQDCALSKVMPLGLYDLTEEKNGDFTFKLKTIRKQA